VFKTAVACLGDPNITLSGRGEETGASGTFPSRNAYKMWSSERFDILFVTRVWKPHKSCLTWSLVDVEFDSVSPQTTTAWLRSYSLGLFTAFVSVLGLDLVALVVGFATLVFLRFVTCCQGPSLLAVDCS